jgi:hypothetical protein
MAPEIWEQCFEIAVRLHREVYSAEPDFRGPGVAALTELSFRPAFTVAEFEAVARNSFERGSFRRLEWFCRDYPANLQRLKGKAPKPAADDPIETEKALERARRLRA